MLLNLTSTKVCFSNDCFYLIPSTDVGAQVCNFLDTFVIKELDLMIFLINEQIREGTSLGAFLPLVPPHFSPVSLTSFSSLFEFMFNRILRFVASLFFS